MRKDERSNRFSTPDDHSVEHIDEAFEFARGLSPRLSSLKWVANHRQDYFAATLFHFSEVRKRSAEKIPDSLPLTGWSALLMLPGMDSFRVKMGWEWSLFQENNSWSKHLYTSTDHIVDAFWHMRQGLTIPAAAIARSMLERWSLNVANEFDVSREENESDEDFITRAWQSYAHLDEVGRIGDWWGWLSEVLHGRNGTEAFGVAASEALGNRVEDNLPHHEAISQVLELCLLQIRGGLAVLAQEAQLTEHEVTLDARWEMRAKPAEPFPLTHAARLLEFHEVHSEMSDYLLHRAEKYRNHLAHYTLGRGETQTSALLLGGFLERRGRAVARAREAFRQEQRALPDEFDPDWLRALLFRYATIAQLARLLLEITAGHEKVALLTAADAVEGASRLWLEDSDYSMACLRVLLEQVARLRTHRLKPTKASRLEGLGTQPASRWLEAAGWKRLGVLMRAVNEFAHLGLRTRQAGARRALGSLQLEGLGPQTGRGDALESVVDMFAFELHARLKTVDSNAAELFIRTITLVDEKDHVLSLEKYLDNALKLKGYDFGKPDFVKAEDIENAERQVN